MDDNISFQGQQKPLVPARAAFSPSDVKSIFSSVTFWGSVFGLLATIAPSFYAMLGITATNQTTVISYIVAAVSWIVTVWGRFHATKTVTLTGK